VHEINYLSIDFSGSAGTRMIWTCLFVSLNCWSYAAITNAKIPKKIMYYFGWACICI